MNGMSETRKAIMARLGFAAGEKIDMSKATDALEYIKNSIASGKTVYVTAGHRTTKVTPQAYAKWEASGKPLFKISGDGALLMASGSSYVRLTLADEMLARVTAMSKSGFAAGEKAAFAITKEQIRGASREELRSIEQRLMALAKSGDKNAAALLDYVEEEYNDRYRGTHSRPGAKVNNEYKVGDRVHGGFGVASGAGVVGTITKIEDGYAYIKGDSEERFGPQIYKVPIQKVTDAPKKSWESAKSTHAADGFYGDSEAEAVRHMAAEAEAEDIKYGDKIKMATDPAVGRKISKLMDEGYPQNQAIAIALDMKRRGEI